MSWNFTLELPELSTRTFIHDPEPVKLAKRRDRGVPARAKSLAGARFS
jgi:hypothetical protein